MAAAPDVLLALASSAPLAALGLVLLAVRPRTREQVFFALFAFAWGLQVAAGNAARIVDDATLGRVALLTLYALEVVTALFLVHFATLLWRRHAPAITWTALAIGALGGLVLVAAPQLLVESVGAQTARQGPLALPLVHGPFYAAFWLALALLWLEYRATPLREARLRLRGVFLALSLFTTFATVRLLLVYVDPPPQVALGEVFGARGYLALFAAGTVALAVLAVAALVAGPREDRRAPVVLAFAVPAAWAVGEGTLQRGGLFFDTIGLWRILTVALILYALARYRLFDLDLRVKVGLRRGTVAAIFIAGTFMAVAVAEAYLQTSYGWIVGGLAAGIFTLAIHPIQSLAARVADTALPGVAATPQYMTYRKLQVYRAALETVLADETVTAKERATLGRLATELGIAPDDAAALEAEVRSAVGHERRPPPKPPLDETARPAR